MIKISREEWERKKRQGYTHFINGKPYILTMDNGATVLAPVEIETKQAAEKSVTQVSFFDTEKGVNL